MKEIKLTRNQVALIDDEDANLVEPHRWYANPTGRTIYARRWVKGKHILMHRLIMNLTDPKVFVDHINSNGLDNRRSNLRIATASQNQWNRRRSLRKTISKFVGVRPSKKRWTATVIHYHKPIYAGCFKTEEEAAMAYDAKARELHGEYAYQNFPCEKMGGK